MEFHTVKLEMRINDRKLGELREEIERWVRRTVASKQELQSILGKLMWVSRCVKFSRCFINRIISEIKKLSSQKDKTTLSLDVRKDLLWWKHFVEKFNGVHLIVPDVVSVNVAGDACPSGLGSWNLSSKEYFSLRFPLYLQDPQIPIHVKEFICVILASKKWGS